MTLEEVRQRRADLVNIARRHGAKNLRVFGSVARGDADQRSDLDLLVDLEEGRTLMDLGGFLMEVQSEFTVHVDVATERILRPEIRGPVISEAVPI